MRLENKSRFRDDDLRAFIAACLRSRDVPSTGLLVEVSAARSGGVSGVASIGRWRSAYAGGAQPSGTRVFVYGRHMKLVLPGDEGQRDRIARVIDHEVAHLQGLDHKAMGERLYDCTQDVPWAEGLPLRLAEAPPVDRVAANVARETHARAMLAKAETRLKRAETIAKKWRRRVAAYARRA